MSKKRKLSMSGYLMGTLVAVVVVTLSSGCLFKKKSGGSTIDPADATDALNDELNAGAGGGADAGGGGGASAYDPNATAISYGTVNWFNTSRPYDIKTVKLSSTKLVTMFRDMATGGRLKAVVGDISGTNVNWGPKQSIDDNCTGCYNASIAALSATRIVVAYPDTNNGDQGVARTCEVSGATLTCNASVLFAGASISTGNTSVASLSATEFVVSYFYNSVQGRANVGSVALDGSISYSGGITFETGGNMVLQTMSAVSSTQVVIAYEDGSDLKGKAVVGTVGGGTITFSPEYTFNLGATSLAIASTSLGANNKFVVAYEKQDASGVVKVGTVAGTGATASLTFGAETMFSNDIEQDISVSALAADKFVVSCINNNIMDYGQNGGVSTIGKVSGNTATLGWGYRHHTYGWSKPSYSSVAGFSDKGFLTIVCDKEGNKGAAYVGTVSAM